MPRDKDILARRNKAMLEMWKALEDDKLPNGSNKHTYQAKIHYMGEIFWLRPRSVEEILFPRGTANVSDGIFSEEELKAMQVVENEEIDEDDIETELEHYFRRATEILPSMIRLYKKAKQGQNPQTAPTSELKTAQPKNSL